MHTTTFFARIGSFGWLTVWNEFCFSLLLYVICIYFVSQDDCTSIKLLVAYYID